MDLLVLFGIGRAVLGLKYILGCHLISLLHLHFGLHDAHTSTLFLQLFHDYYILNAFVTQDANSVDQSDHFFLHFSRCDNKCLLSCPLQFLNDLPYLQLYR